MSNVPSVSGAEVISVLAKDDFQVVRITGSHHILKKDGNRNAVSVPVHGNQSLKRGTLCGIVRKAGMTMERFIELCNE
jgi:predicted RNA binding protein YcfA (HicA-like mRNA interferase family)